MMGGAQLSAWHLFHAYRHRGHTSWLAVGEKVSHDPDVFVLPHDAHRSLPARLLLAMGSPWWPLIGRIRGVGMLKRMVRWIGEPQAWVHRERGVEDFNFPGTWKLLDLPPQVPDVVHCHNLHLDYFDLRVLPWLSHQVPIILNLRDAWLLTGHCAYFLDCERWQTGCGNCPYLHTYPPVKRDATAYNWQRKRDIYARSRLYLTAPSQWLLDKVHRSMLHGHQERVIPNAIDLEIFRPGDRQAARQELDLPLDATIIVLTRQTHYKDYDTMEAALAQLVPVDARPLLFLCLGRGGTDKNVGQGRMVYPGYIREQQRMARYYQAADVFIHAAKDEAFGKTICEARACGTPVVATAVGGIPEQVMHGHTGLLVPPGDSATMAGEITKLLTQPSLYNALVEAGAAQVRKQFGLKQQADAFLAWYPDVREDWQAWKRTSKVPD
jgi:glycosyltransferase involved in cell wall biosynthesis